MDAGINTNHGTDKSYRPAGAGFSSATDTTGQYAITQSDATMTTINAGLAFPVPLPRGAHLAIRVGTNFQGQSVEATQISTTGLAAGVTEPTSFIPSLTSGNRSSTKLSTFGWWVEPQLYLSGRLSQLFITPAVRLDNNGASGVRAGLTVLPKFNLSYVLWGGDRPAPEALSFLVPQLRLRGVVGVAGVQPNPVDRLRLFSTTMPVSLDGGATTSEATMLYGLGNTQLHPERSSEFAGGFDVDLLGSRLALAMTYSNKLRKDEIISVQTAPSVGGARNSKYSLNIGAVRNRSFEMTSHARLLDRTAVQWDIDLNASSDENRVISLAPGQQPLRFQDGTRVVPGYPLFGIWARPVVAYADRDGDGTIAYNDEITLADDSNAVFVGATDPTYQANVATNISFFNNRISMASTFAYTHGLTQFYGSGGLVALRSAANAPDASLLTQAIAVATNESNNFGRTNYYLYQRVNTLRWQSLSINVRLPNQFAQRLGSRSATLALQGSNLGLHTNYRGKDPNVNAFASGNGVADLGQLPQPRTWTLRLSITR
jgi:hypothetical protein